MNPDPLEQAEAHTETLAKLFYRDGYWHCYECGEQIESLGPADEPICSDCYAKLYGRPEDMREGGWE